MFKYQLLFWYFIHMASSKKLASSLSRTSSSLYFLLIFFQIPLFRVPCSRVASCTTPLELTCSQLLASEVFPQRAVKALLYPGAVAKAILRNKPIPTFDTLPNLYKFIDVKPAADLHRLEVTDPLEPIFFRNLVPVFSDLLLQVIAGSYLAVGGAMMGMVRPGSGRMSLFGCLVAIWGIVWRKSSYSNPKMELYPNMFLALALAFLSIRRDVRRIVRCVKAQGSSSWKKVKCK